MPRQRCLYRDFCRLEVADLTDQNDVGILSQKGAQRGRKIQTDLLLHLHLVDSRQLKLNRILSGHDVGVDGV